MTPRTFALVLLGCATVGGLAGWYSSRALDRALCIRLTEDISLPSRYKPFVGCQVRTAIGWVLIDQLRVEP